MNKEIREVDFAELIYTPLKNELDNLVFSSKTIYYALFVDLVQVGFTGLVYYRGTVKFKNHFIRPEFRGNGYFKLLFDFSLYHARGSGVKYVSANCVPASVREYLKVGAVVVREFKNGVKEVKLKL